MARVIYFLGCFLSWNMFTILQAAGQSTITKLTPECPDGSPKHNCLVAPCSVTTCKANAKAECRNNYCGGCNAEFYYEGKKIECSVCGESQYGCCEDGVTSAKGPEKQGCPGIWTKCKRLHLNTLNNGNGFLPLCQENGLFNPRQCWEKAGICWCSDLEGFEISGTRTTYPQKPNCKRQGISDCKYSSHGCCGDDQTFASGPDFKGCPALKLRCDFTKHGCCGDGVTSAKGPRREGCPTIPSICNRQRETAQNKPGPVVGLFIPECRPDGSFAKIQCHVSTGYCWCVDDLGKEIKRTRTRGKPDCDAGKCQDKRKDCEEFAKNTDYCEAYKEYMGKYCAKACKFCSPVATTAKPYQAKRPGCKGTYGCCEDGLTPAIGPEDEGCPVYGSVCLMPAILGPCEASLPRYFFNRNLGRCEKFFYGGCKGNQNNFKSLAECERFCFKSLKAFTHQTVTATVLPRTSYKEKDKTTIGSTKNPSTEARTAARKRTTPLVVTTEKKERTTEIIYTTVPRTTSRPKVSTTTASKPTTKATRAKDTEVFTRPNCGSYFGCCQDGMIPAVGPNFLGCPEYTSVCQMPAARGPCRKLRRRYFYNFQLEKCEGFEYGGCGGNGNNFATLRICLSTCMKDMPADKLDAMMPTTSPPTTVGTKPFESLSECQKRRRLATQTAKTYSGSVSLGNRMFLPDCNEDGSFKRVQCWEAKGFCWCVDKDGNQIANTQAKEPPSNCPAELTQPDRNCKDKMSQCKAQAAVPRYCKVYSTFMKTFCPQSCGFCERIQRPGCNSSYGCCEDGITPAKGTGYKGCPRYASVCEMPMVTGPCRGLLPRFFYNKISGKCEKFIFGGCRGNMNNFPTSVDCYFRCEAGRPTTKPAILTTNVRKTLATKIISKLKTTVIPSTTRLVRSTKPFTTRKKMLTRSEFQTSTMQVTKQSEGTGLSTIRKELTESTRLPDITTQPGKWTRFTEAPTTQQEKGKTTRSMPTSPQVDTITATVSTIPFTTLPQTEENTTVAVSTTVATKQTDISRPSSSQTEKQQSTEPSLSTVYTTRQTVSTYQSTVRKVTGTDTTESTSKAYTTTKKAPTEQSTTPKETEASVKEILSTTKAAKQTNISRLASSHTERQKSSEPPFATVYSTKQAVSTDQSTVQKIRGTGSTEPSSKAHTSAKVSTMSYITTKETQSSIRVVASTTQATKQTDISKKSTLHTERQKISDPPVSTVNPTNITISTERPPEVHTVAKASTEPRTTVTERKVNIKVGLSTTQAAKEVNISLSTTKTKPRKSTRLTTVITKPAATTGQSKTQKVTTKSTETPTSVTLPPIEIRTKKIPSTEDLRSLPPPVVITDESVGDKDQTASLLPVTFSTKMVDVDLKTEAPIPKTYSQPVMNVTKMPLSNVTAGKLTKMPLSNVTAGKLTKFNIFTQSLGTTEIPQQYNTEEKVTEAPPLPSYLRNVTVNPNINETKGIVTLPDGSTIGRESKPTNVPQTQTTFMPSSVETQRTTVEPITRSVDTTVFPPTDKKDKITSKSSKMTSAVEKTASTEVPPLPDFLKFNKSQPYDITVTVPTQNATDSGIQVKSKSAQQSTSPTVESTTETPPLPKILSENVTASGEYEIQTTQQLVLSKKPLVSEPSSNKPLQTINPETEKNFSVDRNATSTKNPYSSQTNQSDKLNVTSQVSSKIHLSSTPGKVLATTTRASSSTKQNKLPSETRVSSTMSVFTRSGKKTSSDIHTKANRSFLSTTLMPHPSKKEDLASTDKIYSDISTKPGMNDVSTTDGPVAASPHKPLSRKPDHVSESYITTVPATVDDAKFKKNVSVTQVPMSTSGKSSKKMQTSTKNGRSLTICEQQLRKIKDNAVIVNGKPLVLLGAFTPRCEKNGDFAPIQCHGSIGFCWCVTKTGTEIQGTRTRGTPNCSPATLPQAASICTLPVVHGNCNERIFRWYFNKHMKACQSFQYSGCGGNENNFRTIKDCVQSCILRPFKPTKPQRNKPTTTVKTTKAKKVDTCSYKVNQGNCSESILRWFYNYQMEACQPFLFTGCGGNANNFATAMHCNQVCGDGRQKPFVALDRKTAGSRTTYSPVETITIATETKHSPMEKNNGETTPSSPVNTCTLPPQTGPCRGYVDRWFFDSSSATCTKFVFGGCGGNVNNFKSERACLASCLPTKTTVWPVTQSSRTTTNKCNSRFGCCKDGVTPADGPNYESCPSYKSLCAMPPVPGPCGATITRWFYNKELKSCTQFVWGGCDGNENNFGTAIECLRACSNFVSEKEHISSTLAPPTKVFTPTIKEFVVKSTTEEPSLKVIGCNSAFGCCDDKFYGAKGPNKEGCPVYNSVCDMPLVKGSCKARIVRWYYDPTTLRCESFIFTGCGGNKNNFANVDACSIECEKGQPLCIDRMETNCPLWKEQGYCQSRRTLMSKYCKKSCDQCY